ncbi:MAG: antitoxin [Betaproteobacteria bacterium]|nr:antitoxin [Betaproteobacteria bacterium]
MRTTLDIDDDVLALAKELARRERKSAGQVISELAKRALTQTVPPNERLQASEPDSFCGFRPFASRGPLVGNEEVDRLRDQEGV